MKSRPVFELQIGGRRVRLGERTLVMGVLNVTPDSFSDGGRYFAVDRAVAHGLEMARQGADWTDVGGESARPGALPVSADEELRRVLPVIRGLRHKAPSLVISIDTTKAEVAEEAVRAGASVINDVSGLRFDARVAEVARQHSTLLILMHLRGRPATMQRKPFAPSVWRSVCSGLAWSVRRALKLGVRRSQLIVDPGMGFGKSRRQNYEIISGLQRLHSFRLPVLVGTSRKSFVQAVVAGEGLDVTRRKKSGAKLWPLTEKGGGGPLDIGDAAMVAATVLGGAHIVRVHDVAAVLPAIRIADAILTATK